MMVRCPASNETSEWNVGDGVSRIKRETREMFAERVSCIQRETRMEVVEVEGGDGGDGSGVVAGAPGAGPMHLTPRVMWAGVIHAD